MPAMNSVTRSCHSLGTTTSMTPALMADATPTCFSLITRSTLVAVFQSWFLRWNRTTPRGSMMRIGMATSTSAPFGIDATVGWLIVTDDPESPLALTPLTTTGPSALA